MLYFIDNFKVIAKISKVAYEKINGKIKKNYMRKGQHFKIHQHSK